MKKSILTLVAAAMALGAFAEAVSPEMAMAAANAWVLRNGKFGAGRAATGQVITVRDTNEAATVLWHQVSMSGDGCVIVAPATEIEPVVVALDNDPGELPAAHPLRGILTKDMRDRLRLLGLYPEEAKASLQGVAPAAPAPVDEEKAAFVSEWAAQQQAKWARLGIGGASLQASAKVGLDVVEMEVCVVKGFERGGALTHWNQGNGGGGLCYNLYTPNNCVCGCVATACSAIVQYFAATNGVKGKAFNGCSYNGKSTRLLEMFDYQDAMTMGGEYDWSLLAGCTKRSDYNHLTKEQRELLGRVAYDAGVGVDMMWGDGASGAMEANIARALKEVFGFKNARYVGLNGSNPGEENLRKLVYGQCAAGAPVGLGIEGHSVVAVGYGQDSDGVERVRVFMGWGGSGDGWYALPYVDTKATMGGSSYLSTVVDGVVTMISLEDNNIVPVVGQATAGGFGVTFLDVVDPVDRTTVDPETGAEETTRTYESRIVQTDDNGWFATRVPPVVGTYSFVCAGKTGEYTVGPECIRGTVAARLSASTPDWVVPFPLLNSTVTFSFDAALKAALAEGKAILRVSGTSGETNTQAVLNHIYEMDENNTNDFTNRFVYLFTTYSTTNGDVRPSYCVYLPQAAQTDERWYFTNGRLAYGYGRQAATTEAVTITNVVERIEIVEDEEDPDMVVTNTVLVTNIVAAAGTNVLVSTYAPTGSTPVYETFMTWPTYEDGAREAFERSLDAVIEQGWEAFTKRSSGITVTVRSTGSEAGVPVPAWGTTKDVYKDGETIVATVSSEMTNEVAGVVLGCKGYELTSSNTVTGVVLTETGDGTEVSYTASANDQITVTWTMVTNAVRVVVDPALPKASAGTTEPGTGWYKYGEQVVFTAKPADKWTVERWNGSTAKGLPLDAAAAGPSLLFTATEPVALNVKFRQQTLAEQKQEIASYAFSATSYFLVVAGGDIVGLEPAPDAEMPGLKLYGGADDLAGTTIAMGEETTLPSVSVALAPEPLEYVDADGQKWTCSTWTMYDPEEGETPAHEAGRIGPAAVDAGLALSAGHGALAGYTPSCDVKLVLYWAPVEEEKEEEEVKVELPIAWNEDLDNLHTGEVVLLSAEQASRLPANAKVTMGEPPQGWKVEGDLHKAADGSYVATLVLDEEVLAPVAVEGESPLLIAVGADGKLIVKAEVANGVRGFWYSLCAADDLTGPWSVMSTGYVSGEPVKQATSPDGVDALTVAVKVDPQQTKRFYKLIVTEKDPATL